MMVKPSCVWHRINILEMIIAQICLREIQTVLHLKVSSGWQQKIKLLGRIIYSFYGFLINVLDGFIKITMTSNNKNCRETIGHTLYELDTHFALNSDGITDSYITKSVENKINKTI